MTVPRSIRAIRSATTVLARCLCGVALSAATLVCAAHAQAPGERFTLSEIRVEGAQRVEPETVQSYLTIRQGDTVDAGALDRSLKSLFATGLFADVTLQRQGSVLVVRVVENPIINRLAFEGNSRVSDQTLRDEVRLRPRRVYTRSSVQADVQRIIDIYRRSGRFAATVEPKVIQLPQNRVDLVFEIDEGKQTEIRKITFVGNRRFSDSTLRGVIQTKESAWYRILSSTDTYDPDRLTFDRELLRRHYLAGGYADFRVISAVAELTPDREGFLVTFTVEEGERYKFGKIDIETALRNLKPEELKEKVTVKDGDWYNADAVETTVTNLTDAAGSLGYAFVDVRPRVRRERDGKVINITFDIREGPRVFVERINVTGNLRTEDRVIRREFTLVEGDAFNTAKLRKSRTNVRNLGFFEKVEVANVPGSAPDKTVISATVEEKSTGEISFGAGFSSTAGLLGDISLRERNLLGRGQDLRLGLSIGQRQQQIDLRFTEPRFLERNISAGADAFRTSTDLQRESSFNRESLGGALRMGYRLTDTWGQRWRYQLRQDEVTDIKSTASLAIQEQVGTAVTSAVGHTIYYDARDSRVQPTQGFLVELETEFAGIGGDVHYLKDDLSGSVFFPITADVIGSIGGATGYIFGIDDDVRIVNRFFLGGNTLRGFANAGIGPRDRVTGDALGGQFFYRGTAETTFPLGLPNELGIRGRVFTDAGSLSRVDGSFGQDTDTDFVRVSAGVGLGWSSPFGPINIDLGFPIRKEEFDKRELIRFSFGTRF
jgi:outer membrane protein insertion porin family